MSDRNLPLDDAAVDDLPRTLRRQREARERATREALSTPPAGRPAAPPAGWDLPPEPVPAVVQAIQVPFFSLVVFFLKAVVAAIPALVLLTVILFAGGQALKHFFPNLRHFEIEIRPVGSALDPAPAPAPALRPVPPPRK